MIPWLRFGDLYQLHEDKFPISLKRAIDLFLGYGMLLEQLLQNQLFVTIDLLRLVVTQERRLASFRL